MAIPFPDALTLAYLALVFFVWTRRVLVTRTFRQTNPPIGPGSSKDVVGTVSVIVPARDEERNIGNCLTHLFNQDHSDYEIVVVDDRSEDRTPHLVSNFQRLSTVPFKAVRVEKLPPGWTGKNHAMMVGSKAAEGNWFLFTDADTTHSPQSVSSALKKAVEEKIDFLTLAPEVECGSFWENTVQPLAVSSLAMWFDTANLNRPDSKRILANGQFILIRREAYEAVGGSECVKNEVIEDVEFAKKVHAAGFKVAFLNGTELYSTRMYTSLSQIIRGWTRIYIHLFEKKLPAILHKILLFALFSILPFAVLAAEAVFLILQDASYRPAIFAASAAVCAWIVLARFLGNRLLRTNPWYAFLHPVGSLVMTWILGVCVARILLKRRSEWRGDLH